MLLIAPILSLLGNAPWYVIATIILGTLFFYFIPTLVGLNKKSVGGIFVLNFFLGWTLLAWVGALIWACIGEKEVSAANKKSSVDSTELNG